MATVQGSVVHLVGGLCHSLESTHWNGVLAVSLGPVRNSNDRLEVAVIQLLPSPIRLNLQHQQQVCLTSDADGLRSVVGLYLNSLSIGSDGVIATGPSTCLGQSVMVYRQELPVVPKQVPKTSPAIFRRECPQSILCGEHSRENVPNGFGSVRHG